jgi:hypothetical protein
MATFNIQMTSKISTSIDLFYSALTAGWVNTHIDQLLANLDIQKNEKALYCYTARKISGEHTVAVVSICPSEHPSVLLISLF